MEPDHRLDERLAQLARADLDPFRSQRLRMRAHRELRRAADVPRSLLEPLLLATCATVVLGRLLWFVLMLVDGAA
jgi:hypothetical protein